MKILKKFWTKLNKISLLKLWFISLIVKLFDNGTTYYCVSKLGFEAEGNPILRWSMDKFGLDIALLVNYIVFAILTFLLCKFYSRNFLLFIIIISSIVVTFNTIGSLLVFFDYVKPV